MRMRLQGESGVTRAVRWGVGVVLLVVCFAWGGVGWAAPQGTSVATTATSQASGLGRLEQSFSFPSRLYGVGTVIFTMPLGGLGLLPLIGNSVVVKGDWKRSTRINWASAGLVYGIPALIGTIALWTVEHSDRAGTQALVVPTHMTALAIHGATIALSVVNLVKAGRSPRPARRAALPPGQASFRMVLK